MTTDEVRAREERLRRYINGLIDELLVFEFEELRRTDRTSVRAACIVAMIELRRGRKQLAKLEAMSFDDTQRGDRA